MSKDRTALASLLSTLVFLIILNVSLLALPAPAKTWTIYQRQVALQNRIDKAEKSGGLTKKEADALRDRMGDIKNRIEKAKANNGGKISYKDQGKIEKDLNKVSLDSDKKMLEKRVQPR